MEIDEQRLAALGLSDAVGAVASGALSSSALVGACLAQIRERDTALKAFIHLADKAPPAAAAESDCRHRKGQTLSRLDGIPIAVKDNIDVAGQPTTNGLGTAWTPERDAGVVAILRKRGLVLLGKTNMHEGALGATTDNPHHGRTDNPAVPGCTPGGSSGGSAAAVAAGFCPAALGTDTMGSVRLPAAYCGLVGFKPSHDYWPMSGIVPLGGGLDTVGPMARSVADVAMLLDLPVASRGLAGLEIAVLRNWQQSEIEVPLMVVYREALERLRLAGATLREVTLPDYEPSTARRAGLLISEVDGWLVHEEQLGACSAAFSPAFRSMLDYGARTPAPRYAQARQEIARIAAGFSSLLASFDAVIGPTTPQTAFPHGAPAPADQADFTAPANFAGCPAISMPAHRRAAGRPVGIQIMTGRGDDEALLAIAAAIESLLKEE